MPFLAHHELFHHWHPMKLESLGQLFEEQYFPAKAGRNKYLKMQLFMTKERMPSGSTL